MIRSEAEEISELIKYLPENMQALVSNEYKKDNPLHDNGWYAYFEAFDIKVYEFKVAEGMYIVLAALAHKGKLICD